MNEDVVKEIWKTYPEFGWIQASNLGRYRTITREIMRKDGKKYTAKGHYLKPHRTKDGYLELTLGVNGKNVHRKAHRVTAMTFIPNPKGLEQVNHKNCIRDDNKVKNLEWCSNGYNIAYREKYGKSASEVFGRPLWAYNLKTDEKLYFATQVEAGRETGASAPSINDVLKGRKKQICGYWFTEDEDEITDEKIQSIKDNMKFLGGVIAINLEAQEPLRFKTRKEAARSLKCNAGNIGSIIVGRYKQTKGFWFCHADENAVEATRAKFGDEVANKVAELMDEN